MKKTLDLLFIIGVCTALIHYSYRNNVFFFIVLLCGILLLMYYLTKMFKQYLIVIFFICIFTSLFLIKILYYQDTGELSFLALFIAHFGFGMYLIENQNSLKSFMLIYVTLFFVLLLYFLNGTPPREISELSSENIVNYIFLALSVLLVGLYFNKLKTVLVFPALLSIAVSFWTMGRAGIIASIIFLIGTIFVKYKKRLHYLSFGLILILSSLTAYFVFNLIEKLTYSILYRFGERTTFLEDSGRLAIIKDYFSKLDINKIIFGYNFHDHYFAGFTNLHNSYLDMHYKFGIAGIFTVLILLVVQLAFLYKKKYLYFVLMISLLFRGVSDIVMLVGMYDFVLIFFVLICFKELVHKKRVNLRASP